MKRIWNTIINWILSGRLKRLQEIEKAFEERTKQIQTIYTSVKTFTGMSAEYYGWVCRLLESEEYKYMCFDLRENIIREMIGIKDEKEIIRSAGRLDMINVIGNYLARYKVEYEKKILGNPKQ